MNSDLELISTVYGDGLDEIMEHLNILWSGQKRVPLVCVISFSWGNPYHGVHYQNFGMIGLDIGQCQYRPSRILQAWGMRLQGRIKKQDIRKAGVGVRKVSNNYKV